jgi:acyl-coenzyme A synthetase/AMP-(fatty) acid ligase
MIPIRISIGATPGWLELEESLAAAPERLDAVVMEAEDPAIMYYTSGSTGEPKAVVHSARGIFAWRNSAIHWLDLKPFDRIWCTADTGWSKAGTSILFGPWSCGATTFIFDGPFLPANRLELLAKHRIHVYCAPGAELYRVAQEDVSRYDLSSLRRTVSAGEVVSPVVAQRWEKATGIRVDEAYGQTETLMLVWNSPADDLVYGSMGHPAPGCDVAPIDAAGLRCPVDCEGDLALLTPNPQMMLGYWREPNRTAASFRDGPEGRWYVTGDRALVDARGYLFYRGRADDVINSAGYRIGPWEVENVLMEHPAVAQCAVVGSPDEERGEVVKAFIVLRDGIVPDEALKVDIQTHAKSNTAPYKYPRRVEFVQTLPTTPTGKIRRRDLREQERNRLTNRSSG